jgi:hypothetical protein
MVTDARARVRETSFAERNMRVSGERLKNFYTRAFGHGTIWRMSIGSGYVVAKNSSKYEF